MPIIPKNATGVKRPLVTLPISRDSLHIWEVLGNRDRELFYAGKHALKIIKCPTYLPAQWRRIYEAKGHPPLGACLALFILHAMDEFDARDGVKRYSDLIGQISLADDLSLKAATELHLKIGSMSKPTYTFAPSCPCNDVQPWQFRCGERPQDKIYGRANELGMSASNLMVPLLARGMATQESCVHHDLIATAAEDFERFVRETEEREPALRELFEFYRGR
jgi:hypothetical protein